MSQMPPTYHADPRPAPSGNAMGVLGFVLSILGLFSCGILSPIGLIFSAIGMRKEPKDLAIAGLVINIVALVVFIPVVMFFGLPVLFCCALLPFAATQQPGGTPFPSVQTMMATQDEEATFDAAEVEVQTYIDQAGGIPSDDEAEQLLQGVSDVQGFQPRYQQRDLASYLLILPGDDLLWDTPDDVVREVYPDLTGSTTTVTPALP